MEKIKIAILVFISTLLRSQTDFKYDDTIYKTMFPKDLCAFLKNNLKTLLIDVRSPGEFSDTSMYQHLNIGHLKGAKNIPIDSISKNIPELKKQSENPIILYCSHSQRSRRVSKILMENGFMKVYNLNGGMTWMNQANEKGFPCKKEMIISQLPYKSISSLEVADFIKNNKDLVILDVRPATEFEGKDTLEGLNLGRFKNAINIPFDELKKDPSKADKYKNKTILVYDNSGSQSNPAAKLLTQNGFSVYHLLGGITEIVGRDNDTKSLRNELLDNSPAYTILNIKQGVELLSGTSDLTIIDSRPAEEFNGQAKESWKNLGIVKNAMNIPQNEFDSRSASLLKDKTATILIYGPYAARYCRKLKEAGFENVNYLYGSMWGMISTYKNVYGFNAIAPLLDKNKGYY
jgi:rhodanese-related sulfurtransferase